MRVRVQLAEADLQTAREQSEACDLAIFIGSSLKVLHHYPFIWQQPPKPRRKVIVIINLQPTPRDRAADLRIHGRYQRPRGRRSPPSARAYLPRSPDA